MIILCQKKSKRKVSRRSKQTQIRHTILIVTEGKETEPNYFNKWKSELRKVASVKIVGGDKCGTHPRNIVEYAIAMKRGASYDHVWCVFDRDSHPKIHEAIKMAEGNDLDYALSNPCFELWLLIHFQNQEAHIERKALCSILKKHIPDYDKSMSNIYDAIINDQNKAIKHASALRQKHLREGTNTEEANPSTGIDKLVLKLNNLK